jgi:hypothetical protein
MVNYTSLIVDSDGSPEFIRLLFEECEVPLTLNSVWLMYLDTSISSDGGDLDLIRGFFISVEHDLHAILDHFSCFFLS